MHNGLGGRQRGLLIFIGRNEMQASRLRRSSMGKLVLLVVFLAASFPVLAADRACLISFDSAVLDVCSGQVRAVDPALAELAEVARFASSEYRVVKFDQNVGRTQREAIERVGGTILGYVPHHAYLVRLPATMASAAAAIEGVVWTGPYLPIWKLDVNLARDLAADAGARRGTNIIREAGIEQLVIGLHAGAQRDALLGRIQSLAGLSLDLTFSGFDGERLLLSFERDLLSESVIALAAEDAVASISLHWPNDFMNSQAPGLHQSGTISDRPLYDQGLFGCGQIIGAADSGLHATHCSFSDTDYGQPVTSVCPSGTSCAAVTPDFDHRKIGAHYKWDGSTSGGPADNQGHGTHVIGSILGNNPAGAVDCEAFTTPGGVTDLDGTAPGAKLISQEMGASLQYLNSLGGTIYHAATVAYDNGARIHNNSWGSSCRNQVGQCIAGCQVEYRQTTRDADAAVWEFPELAVFVAAGNSGGLGGGAGCGPGADVGAAGNGKNVFSIGSNNRGTGGNNMSGFSSRGPTQDRRSKPDMTAQGASIVSASRTACGTVGNSGTSMATPTAAGLAALVREYLARGFYPLGVEVPVNAMAEPSAALIKAIMINGAQEITGTGTTGGAPSQSQGWGRVHLNNALFFDGDDRRLWLVDGKDGLETDDVDSHILNVESGQPLIVTLSWHDAPATVNANPHSVNRLRLEVETPSGEVWTQKLTPGGGLADPNPFQASSAGDYDDANNVHQIRFDSPAAGAYLVRVRGIQVAEGEQPYALAATGDLLGIGEPDFLLTSTPGQLAVCSGDDAVYDIGVLGLVDFDDPVTLSEAGGLPPAATASFSVNPVTPADPAASSILTIADTDTVTAGTYAISISGQSSGPGFDPATRTVNIGLTVDEALAGPALTAPADAATDVGLRPDFEWTAQSGAADYSLQVATDPGFSGLVIDTVVDEPEFTPAFDLATGTDYYWRVRGNNACGDGLWSMVFEFQTRFVPLADVTPASMSFNVAAGSSASDTLTISNVGTGSLVWDVLADAIEAADVPLFGGDFDIANWELVNTPSAVGGSFTSEPGPPLEVFVTGGNAGTGGVTDLQIEIPVDGTISFDWGYQATDIACWDSGGYAVNGIYTELACNDAAVPYFDGSATVELSAGDIFAFRVFTDDGQFGAGTFGVSNFQFDPDACDMPSGLPWLSFDPASGSTTAGASSSVTVTADSAGLGSGGYEGHICVASNDASTPMISVPVALTVTDVNAGTLSGSVSSLGYCSNEPAPAEGATVSIVGDSGTPFTTFVDAGGNYSINLNESESPMTVTVSFANHVDATETGVNVTAGETTTVDFDLLLEAPCATVSPASIIALVAPGESAVHTMDVGNLEGAAVLDFTAYTAGEAMTVRGGEELYVSGPMVTNPGAGSGGADVSALQTGLGMTTYAAGVQLGAGNRMADAFEVPDDWSVDTARFFVYQTGSTTTSTINSVNVRIWDGPPNDGGSVIFGDTSTNRLISTQFSGIFRTLDTALTNTDRPIMEVIADLEGLELSAGTYWIDAQFGGTLASGPWMPPITIVGETTTGTDSWQFVSGAWQAWLDTGSDTRQGMSFALTGSSAGSCDSPSNVGWLSVSPESGSVAVGGDVELTATLDSAGLANGVYEALVCLSTNDPVNPVWSIPVWMTVGGDELFQDRFEEN